MGITDGYKCLREGSSQQRELEQPEDTRIEWELDNNPPDSLACLLGSLQKAPGSPVEEYSQHEKEEVDVIQVDELLEPSLVDLPYHPERSPDKDDDVPPWPPVHKLGGGQLARWPLGGFVELDLIGQFRFDLKGIFRIRMHLRHQKGDYQNNDNQQDDVKGGEYG